MPESTPLVSPGAPPAIPPAPPSVPPAAVPYRTLSALALLSFLLAAVYAVTVAAFGVIAFVTRTPLLLPTWSLLVPMAAAALAVAGRLRIRRSEGIIAGGALAAWALRLSIAVGLGYVAFYL